jgi:transposase/uncharacterized coiled-coil protein SlyX
MDQGSSSIDIANILTRFAQLEAKVFEQDRIIAEQQQIIVEQRATIATLRDALDTAHEQITLLKKRLFSAKRERFISSPDQKYLFETALLEPPAAHPATPPQPTTSPKKPRKQRRKFVFPDFLPVVRHDHKLDDDQCQCGNCGQARTIINTHITKQIEIDPPQARIEEHVRYTYACPKCRDGKQIITTEKPPTPLEKSPFGASVLAWIIDAKINRHLPLYRQQEMLLEPLGIWLSRSLLSGLLRDSANVLRPLAEFAWQRILESYVVQADETPFQYLGGEKGKSSTGYLFGYAGDAEHRFLYYDYRPSRCRAGPTELLANYRGILLTDGHSAYETVIRESQGRLHAAACWMHARREFDEARATTSHALVEETIARVRLLYDIEDRAKSLTNDQRRELRERESRPLVEKYFAALDQVAGQLRPTTKLAQAVQYSLNRREELSRFLQDGRIEMDTGLLERSLRGPTLGRKNFLFFGSFNGGRTAATLYSIVQSARLYNLNVTAYLTDILRRLAAMSTYDSQLLRDLLPDRWALANPQYILQARQQESRDALEHRRHHRTLRRIQIAG